MYTITLADGTKLENLSMNGDNYVSAVKVDESIFTEANLAKMVVNDGEIDTEYANMVFIQQMEWADGTFYLAFREKTDKEKLLAAITANASSVTDLQEALAEVYELVIGG